MTTGGIAFTTPLIWGLLTLGQILVVTVCVLISVAFLILFVANLATTLCSAQLPR